MMMMSMRTASGCSTLPTSWEGRQPVADQLPASLCANGLGTRFAGGRHAHKASVLPLANRPELINHLVVELPGSQHRFKRALLDGFGHGFAIDTTGCLNRLLEHLQAGVGYGARPEVAGHTGNFFVTLVVALHFS